MSEPFRVLVVCTANICRSPAAATLLSRRWSDLGDLVEVSSAGVTAFDGAPACEVGGHLADEYVPGAARAHAARRVTADLLLGADLVLALDRGHRGALARLAPASRPHTFTLRQVARLADLVHATLEAGMLPPGAPAIPPGARDRLSWLVEEFDAARGSATPEPPAPDADGPRWDPADVPDPHVEGFEIHPAAGAMINDATLALAAAVHQVIAA